MNEFRRRLVFASIKGNWGFSLLCTLSFAFAFFFCLILSTKIVLFVENYSQLRLVDPITTMVYRSGDSRTDFLEEVDLTDVYSVLYSNRAYLPEKNKMTLLAGIDQEIQQFLPMTVTSGRLPGGTGEKREIMLPTQKQQTEGLALGDKIRVENYEYEIVGFQQSYHFSSQLLVNEANFLADFPLENVTVYFQASQSPKAEAYMANRSADVYSAETIEWGEAVQTFTIQHELLFVGITAFLTVIFLLIALANCILIYKGDFQQKQIINGIKLANGLSPKQYIADKTLEIGILSSCGFFVACLAAQFGKQYQLEEFQIVLSLYTIIMALVIGLLIPATLVSWEKEWIKQTSIMALLRGDVNG